ncbi:DUF3710 domain-containing protein [Nocardioides aurantiacus]|uniref:Uncharacterized protein DUF3710 n=1 Tax=Nocardioides aurantiacus TaxID=86796 RepID=A0A3N2CV95_9ACTN|nr:DUF3710 domain-containing protein [Nocardioides aurantiacus]ROR91348.1 uncharacterized protein DUF3710 [Nocardioides aurantiacus]
MRFGRRRSGPGDEGADAPVDEVVEDGERDGEEPPARTRETPETGPYDVSEVDLEERQLVDLGSLLLEPADGVELRLQVEEDSGNVAAVLLVGADGALELRPFAASRGGEAWEELRPRIATETERVGGTATEQEGPFGTELLCLVPVTSSEGESATQASRFVGHLGPTWLLRSNLMGNPAVDPEKALPWDALIRSVVVRRGAEAMPPGSPLPLVLPPDARPASE